MIKDIATWVAADEFSITDGQNLTTTMQTWVTLPSSPNSVASLGWPVSL